jgi:hypothetical protein
LISIYLCQRRRSGFSQLFSLRRFANRFSSMQPSFSIAVSFSPSLIAVFGHYGDAVRRKTTLVIALLTMGISTVSMVLPSYAASESLPPYY